MGMTIAEKILARKSNRLIVHPEEYVVAKIDKVMVMGERLGGLTSDFPDRWPDDIRIDQVFDPERIIVHNEHVIPPDNVTIAALYQAARVAVKKLGIRNFFDIGRGGICHQVFVEKGFALPGELVVGTDSHTCTYGALNTAARGINYELPYILKTGETWFRVPKTIKIEIEGELPKGVYSKDIILHLAGKYGSNFALYKSIEFTGSTVANMSISSRMTMSNMGVEIGAKFAMFEADQKVISYVNERTNEQFEPVFADADALYEKVLRLDVSRLVPQVACPHDLSESKDLTEVEGTRIDQAFLGSCTNARYEDLEIAAQILKGHKIHSDVRMIVTPASEEVYIQAMESGILKIFHDADAVITNSTCGACAGLHLGVIGPGEVCIGTQNRNFQARMGSNDSFLYLASPATVAASAIEGVIADPRKYLR